MNAFQQMKNVAKFSWCSLHSDLQHGASMQEQKYRNEEKLWINKILMGCHTPIEKNVENKESINTEKYIRLQFYVLVMKMKMFTT